MDTGWMVHSRLFGRLTWCDLLFTSTRVELLLTLGIEGLGALLLYALMCMRGMFTYSDVSDLRLPAALFSSLLACGSLWFLLRERLIVFDVDSSVFMYLILWLI
eukprot:gene2412-1515_t